MLFEALALTPQLYSRKEGILFHNHKTELPQPILNITLF